MFMNKSYDYLCFNAGNAYTGEIKASSWLFYHS